MEASVKIVPSLDVENTTVKMMEGSDTDQDTANTDLTDIELKVRETTTNDKPAAPSSMNKGRCKSCGGWLRDAANAFHNDKIIRSDDTLTKDIEAELTEGHAQKLRDIVKRLRDDKWHALQQLTHQEKINKDKHLIMKTKLKQLKDEVKSLRFSQIKAHKSAKAVELMFTKEIRIIAERLRAFLSSVVSGFKKREEELRKAADVDTWEKKIKEAQGEREHQFQTIALQKEEKESLTAKIKELESAIDKLEVKLRSRQDAALQKITSLERGLTMVQTEKEKVLVNLKAATQSLSAQAITQKEKESLKEDLEKSQLVVAKIRLNLENAVRERNIFKDKLYKVKEESDEKIRSVKEKMTKLQKEAEENINTQLSEVKKDLEQAGLRHKEQMSECIKGHKRKEALQSQAMKQAEEKAQKKIESLEEELAMLKSTASKKELEMKNKLKEFLKKKAVDSELKERAAVLEEEIKKCQDEVEKLSSCIEVKTQESTTLSSELHEARVEINNLRRHAVSHSGSMRQEGSFYQNQWSSEPNLNNGSKSTSASKQKSPFQASFAEAISTEDMVKDTGEKIDLPRIKYNPPTSKSLNTFGEGSAAFHPTKEDFRIPKPMDYLRLQKQIQDPKRRQQQKIMNRIFKSNMRAHTLATQNDAQRLESVETELPYINRSETIIEDTAEIRIIKGKEHITVRLPNPYNNTEASPGTSPLVPFNTPANSAQNKARLESLTDGGYQRRSGDDPSPAMGEIRASYENLRKNNPMKGKDYEFSNSKGTEMAHASQGVRHAERTNQERKRMVQLFQNPQRLEQMRNS